MKEIIIALISVEAIDNFRHLTCQFVNIFSKNVPLVAILGTKFKMSPKIGLCFLGISDHFLSYGNVSGTTFFSKGLSHFLGKQFAFFSTNFKNSYNLMYQVFNYFVALRLFGWTYIYWKCMTPYPHPFENVITGVTLKCDKYRFFPLF